MIDDNILYFFRTVNWFYFDSSKLRLNLATPNFSSLTTSDPLTLTPNLKITPIHFFLNPTPTPTTQNKETSES